MPFPEFEPTTPVLIRHLAERHRDKTLIALEDERLSYAEADDRSARLARGLLARGIAKGTRVAILMPNGPDWVVAWLAVTRVGAIAVPLNTFFQARELAWILRHADVDTLLCVASFLGNDYLERLETALPGLCDSRAPLALRGAPYLRRIYVWGEPQRSWSESGPDLVADAGGNPAVDSELLRAVESQVAAADPMLLLYSSGSTADPKGAVHTHGSVIRHSYNLVSRRDLKSDDVVWSPMPLFWVGGLLFSFLGGMHRGATMVVEKVFEPEATLRFLERERVTLAVGWPHFGEALANHPTREARDLSSLRAGNLPGVLPDDVVSADPELRPNALGMTETCGPHTWGPQQNLPESLRGSFGTAVEGLEHKVVSPETGETLAPGELGEICVRGYSLLQGLYKLEREETFDADGFYHTGDSGYFDGDGVLYFKGRLGDMIKTGGANVTPSEVEAALMAFPEVRSAYVVGVPDAKRGQNVAASVLLERGATVEAEELRTRLKREISAYKVARHLFIDEDGSLPFTDTGKIDKRRLERLLAERIER
jgi:acyl-CoA synthetase (AMP-forming)/AMP-acid ligase II